MTETERLAAVLTQRYGHVQTDTEYVRPAASLKVLDCMLSLNRHYDRFVVPRVNQFANNHPKVREVGQLRQLITQYPTPLDFSLAELKYNDARRAETLLGVIDYLIEVQLEMEGRDEAERLAYWATWARPGDYFSVGVRGFGLAGFQYLRMLFGAQTTKPDVHIIRFVSEVVDRSVTDVQALYLLERAAKLTGLPLREVDAAIWQERAHK